MVYLTPSYLFLGSQIGVVVSRSVRTETQTSRETKTQNTTSKNKNPKACKLKQQPKKNVIQKGEISSFPVFAGHLDSLSPPTCRMFKCSMLSDLSRQLHRIVFVSFCTFELSCFHLFGFFAFSRGSQNFRVFGIVQLVRIFEHLYCSDVSRHFLSLDDKRQESSPTSPNYSLLCFILSL